MQESELLDKTWSPELIRKETMALKGSPVEGWGGRWWGEELAGGWQERGGGESLGVGRERERGGRSWKDGWG